MYSGINRDLEKQKENMYEYEKIGRMYTKYEEELDRLQRREYDLKRQLEKENLDVEKLSKLSLKTLFYTILGSQEEQVEKERQEALAAKLKFDQCQQDIEDIRQQMEDLSIKQMEYRDAKRNYEQLYEDKRNRLLSSNTNFADKIMKLTNQITDEKANLKEIKEAILAGNQVLSCLEKALDNLNSAEGWGTWDIFGGGLVTDMIKHSHIDEAKVLASKAQSLLMKFKAELADVDMSTDVNIETDGFAKFADFFFDGLIADWFMQSKINTSQENVESTKNKVCLVVKKLEQMARESETSIKGLENELSTCIVTA